MARFATNPKVARRSRSAGDTTNLAGGPAFQPSAKLELVSTMLTSFVQDQYYRSSNDVLLRVGELLDRVEPLFAAKATLFARREFGMRSITHAVAAEVAKRVKGQPWTRRFFDRAVYRADDAVEILAYYLAKYGKPIPNALKKGLGAALSRQDAYALAKYRREGQPFTLVDVVNLVRPKATPALSQLMKGTLAPAETWEVKLTQAGQSEGDEEAVTEAKSAAWVDLVQGRKLKHLALLRNLRNIAEQAPAALDGALAQLVDPELVRKSLIFPFQVETAYRTIEASGLPPRDARKVMHALEQVVDLSLANVPRYEGESCVILDVSSSMTSNAGGAPAKIGALFAAILAKAWNADIVTFDGSARYVQWDLSLPVLAISKAIGFNGGDTRFDSALELIARGKAKYARIVVLSDQQNWVSGYTAMQAYEKFCRATGSKPSVYSWDLAHQGTIQFPEDKVYCVAGWSDKVFGLFKALEQDRQALVNRIEAVEV
jgi:60 kDa SS-A/Ro ribonucleoprotein